MCPVVRTAQKLGISAEEVFKRATDEKHFTNGEEVFQKRWRDYQRYEVVPVYVYAFCNREAPLVASAVLDTIEGQPAFI